MPNLKLMSGPGGGSAGLEGLAPSTAQLQEGGDRASEGVLMGADYGTSPLFSSLACCSGSPLTVDAAICSSPPPTLGSQWQCAGAVVCLLSTIVLPLPSSVRHPSWIFCAALCSVAFATWHYRPQGRLWSSRNLLCSALTSSHAWPWTHLTSAPTGGCGCCQGP